MLTELKLSILLVFCILRKCVECKTKRRWFYNCLPKHIVTAFTLAEVLITLLVIGVVASITIPSLIANTQEQEYKVAWRKGYANIAQATTKLMSDNGGTMIDICNTNSDLLMGKYLPYLQYTKSCLASVSMGNCWHKASTIKKFDGITATNYFDGGSSVITNDGSLFRFYHNDNDCGAGYGSLKICGSIAVDVNGFKAPNTIGKDIFLVLILKNGVTATGVGTAHPMATDCTSSGMGLGCSALYLTQ